MELKTSSARSIEDRQLILDAMVCTQEFDDAHELYRHPPPLPEMPKLREELNIKMPRLSKIIARGKEAEGCTTTKETEWSVF